MTETHTPEFLYAGADIEHAAKNSRVSLPTFRVVADLRVAFGILKDALHNRFSCKQEPLIICRAEGVGRASQSPLRVVYVGRGANLYYCLSLALRSYKCTQELLNVSGQGSMAKQLNALCKNVPLAFFEDIESRLWQSLQRPAFTMPAWVKQRVAITSSWIEQIGSLRRATRREAARYLRKYETECEITCNDSHYSQFYDELYVPYIRERYGEAAHIVARTRFMSECRGGVVLHLRRNSELVGAALLRRLGATMSVVWTGLQTGRDAALMQGASLSLDYFSLLYAFLMHCRWLDLGPSRADLKDGLLCYKARWGAELYRGWIQAGDIYCSIDEQSKEVATFLRDHAFIVRYRDNLEGRIVTEDWSDAVDAGNVLANYAVAGLGRYRIIDNRPGAGMKMARVRPEHQQIEFRSLDHTVSLAQAYTQEMAET